MRISKHNIHHCCILYALSTSQHKNSNQCFAHAIKYCTEYVNRKKRDRSQFTSVPLFSNYCQPGIIFSFHVSFLCHQQLPLNISFYLTNELYFFSLFVSSQYPHRGNFLLVWATDTRWANKTCGQIKNWKHPSPPPPWGKVVDMKKRQPLVSHSNSTHDPWLSMTFRSLVPLGRSFPASLRSASGYICLAPLASWFYKHLALEQSNEFGVSLPFRVCLLAFFTSHILV